MEVGNQTMGADLAPQLVFNDARELALHGDVGI